MENHQLDSLLISGEQHATCNIEANHIVTRGEPQPMKTNHA